MGCVSGHAQPVTTESIHPLPERGQVLARPRLEPHWMQTGRTSKKVVARQLPVPGGICLLRPDPMLRTSLERLAVCGEVAQEWLLTSTHPVGEFDHNCSNSASASQINNKHAAVMFNIYETM